MISTTDWPPEAATSEFATEESRRARVLPPGLLAILAPMYLFLIAGWFRAGVEKVIDPSWWTGEYLLDFLGEQRGDMLPFFVPFADSVLEPLAPVVAWFVVWTQLMIAVCLVTNRHVRLALWAGIVLNLSFTMVGRVNPSAFYLVMQVTLLFALSRPVALRIAARRATLWLVPALAFAPFARTLDPHLVIDDPALMLSFVSLLAAVTTIAVAAEPTELVGLAASSRFGRSFARRTGISPASVHRWLLADSSSSPEARPPRS
ncbi:hypothetical protein [Ilumatobacter nonamiensis]|uniref:hypothetical protein n=1 Tax=Ilumatobacter nonamiensis TaxID=467093 RepID=UPI0003473675|nr:hypothetical protein [Ilumatobacter nonamiensis]